MEACPVGHLFRVNVSISGAACGAAHRYRDGLDRWIRRSRRGLVIEKIEPVTDPSQRGSARAGRSAGRIFDHALKRGIKAGSVMIAAGVPPPDPLVSAHSREWRLSCVCQRTCGREDQPPVFRSLSHAPHLIFTRASSTASVHPAGATQRRECACRLAETVSAERYFAADGASRPLL
jgi:hypothetical protein